MQLLSACNRMRPVIVLEIFDRSTCSSHLLVFIRVRLFVCLSCFKLDVVFGVCVAFLLVSLTGCSWSLPFHLLGTHTILNGLRQSISF